MAKTNFVIDSPEVLLQMQQIHGTSRYSNCQYTVFQYYFFKILFYCFLPTVSTEYFGAMFQ
jgi:hypothetical protein